LFDTLVTMDQNLQSQQDLSAATLGVVVLQARSNRLVDLLPLVPDILATVEGIQPGELRRVSANS
jgi:hypothetical protein